MKFFTYSTKASIDPGARVGNKALAT